jgi:UDPglucose 6-dehydrogenase
VRPVPGPGSRRQIGERIAEYKIIVNKSTVPVGTADEVHRIVRAEVARRGLSFEFDVVSNPEFLKEGDAVSDFMKPDRIIVGTDNVRTAKLLEALYAPYARSRDKMVVMSVRSAEMTKYAANCMLATKISFINEIANICERVGADVSAVRRGLGPTTASGTISSTPGSATAGRVSRDVKARQHGPPERLRPGVIAAVDAVNHRQKTVLAGKSRPISAGRAGCPARSWPCGGWRSRPTPTTSARPPPRTDPGSHGRGDARERLRSGRREPGEGRVWRTTRSCRSVKTSTTP